MNALPAIALISFLLVAVLGGWRLTLRSVCNANNWRAEIQQGTARLKGSSRSYWPTMQSNCSLKVTKWKFGGKFVQGQKGSVELLSAGLVFLVALMIVFLATLWKLRQKQVDQHLKQTLCLKAAMLETNFMVRRINRINQILVAGEAASWVSVAVAGLGLPAKLSWQRLKKLLQGLQELQWARSQAQFFKLKREGCRLPHASWAGPYQWQGQLKRGVDGRARMRARQSLWMTRTPLMTHWARWVSDGELALGLTWELR